jgi:hypothetical protein
MLNCENDELMTGIVYSVPRTEWEWPARWAIGNLGAICSPVVGNSGLVMAQSDHETVRAAGSLDTVLQGAGTPSQMGYWRYMSTRLTTRNLDNQWTRQNVVRCQPGYVLRGISVRTLDGFVHRIDEIECASRDEVLQTPPYSVLVQQGTPRAGETVTTARCPDALPYARGLNARSGWLLDGFQLRCRT